MSMPDLWQLAMTLRISKKGKKSELIDRISQVQEEKLVFDSLEQTIKRLEKTKKYFEWEPKYSVGRGLSETINWFRLNLDKYRNEI